ncbi:MAG: hypothetical protein WBA93_08790 [Microcoleaceae cyanobacterium]
METIQDVVIIDGGPAGSADFFENHEKYHKFLDTMENPRLFEGYKNMVIDRSDSHGDSCGVDRSLIFPSLAVETT